MRLFDTFSQAYRQILADVFQHGIEVSPRGSTTKELLFHSFGIANPRARTLNVRKYSTSYAIAEALWYLSGSNRVEWIGHYAKFWNNIAVNGECTSAYGYKVMPQIQRVVEELRSSPDSRRAVINILLPSDHANPKDVPCTIALHYLIRKGALHAQTYMRSCDIIWGLPYDVFSFTIFQELIASRLEIPLGAYFHTASSLHLYERHGERAMNALNDLDIGCRHPQPMLTMEYPVPIQSMILAEMHMRQKQEVIVYTEQPYWNDWLRILAIRNGYDDSLYNCVIDPGLSGANR